MKTKITIEKVELHAGKEFKGTPWNSQCKLFILTTESLEDLTRDSGQHYHLGQGYHGCPNHIWAYPLFLLGEYHI